MIFGIIIVILSAIIYGIIPLLTKIIYTFGLVIPILFVICFIKNKPLKINISSLISIFLYIALPSGFTMLLLNASYTYISIGTATTLHFLYPTFVILMCSFYYHQKIERRIIVSLILITMGISCFIDEIDINGILGVILAFLSAITYAIYLVQLEQSKFRTMNPLVLSLYTSICISIVLGIVGFCSKSLLLKESTFNSGLLFYLVILSTLSMIALVFLQIGARYLGAKLTALFSLFEPITSIFAGIIFLNEELQFLKIIGCLFILFAILNITFSQSK